MKISGNTILITGATSGIGRALAEALHVKGNRVVIAGRRQHLLDEIVAKNPGMNGIAVDLSDVAAIDRFASEVKHRFPDLNVLINNAGIARPENYSADKVDTTAALEILQTNITSVVLLTAALLPVLKAQPASTLMTTTSGLAFVPLPGAPTYSATKAFLHSWLESIRQQLRQTSVEVLELAPPYVQTELGGERQKNDPRAMPLDAFTSEVVSILENGTIENGEILVENVKPLRWAERDGHYEQVLANLASFSD